VDLIEPRNTDVGRTVVDVFGNVRGPREQKAHLRVDRVGVEFAIRAVFDMEPGPFE